MVILPDALTRNLALSLVDNNFMEKGSTLSLIIRGVLNMNANLKCKIPNLADGFLDGF